MRQCREECICRFCRKKLPDWKQKMTPENVTPCRTAVMAVVLNGEEHRITVEPGRTGRKHFEREIRRLFQLSQEDELEFTFDCQTPGNGATFLSSHNQGLRTGPITKVSSEQCMSVNSQIWLQGSRGVACSFRGKELLRPLSIALQLQLR